LEAMLDNDDYYISDDLEAFLEAHK